MKKSLIKDSLRQIRKSFGRFLSIFLIIALGVGFYAGIKATAPDMKNTADKYFDDYRLFDIRVLSTMGFNEDDVNQIKGQSQIEGVLAGYSVDLIAEFEESSSVVKLMSLPVDKVETNDESYINRVKLVEGRYPEKPGEILVESGDGASSTYPIGSKIKFKSGTDDDIADLIKHDEYIVVGRVNSPQYLSFERGTTSIGTGQISSFMMVAQEEFELPVYTDIYLTVEEARNVMTYDEEYDNILSPIKDELEDLGQIRSQARYDEIMDEAYEKIDEAKEELQEAETELQEELSKAESDLEDARKQIEDGERELNQNEREFNNQIAQGENTLNEEEEKLLDAESEYEKNLNLFNEEENEAIRQIENEEREIAKAEQELESKEIELNQLKESVDFIEDKAEKAKIMAIIEASEAELLMAREQLEAGKAQIEEARQALIGGKSQLNAAKIAIEEGKTRIAGERQNLNNNKNRGLAEFRDARAELAQGKEEYESGYAEYLSSKEEAEEEIEKAKKEIAEEEENLKDLEEPEWYVFKRTDTYDYIDYEMAADRIDAVSTVFPVFFLAIAVLVCLTTMTRMVDEERVYIGTLKALGYSNMSIASKYLMYAALASISGGIFGLLLGLKILPTVIFNAYRIMYIMPEVTTAMDIGGHMISVIIAVLATLMATWSACRHELSEAPASLMRPKSPKPGKRILLERIGFIWSRMKFTQKVASRNIFRYKKRFIMTVLGISGCTALLLTGYGIKDSIVDIADNQFNELYSYEMVVEFKDELEIGEDNETINYVDGDSRIGDYILVYEKVMDVGNEDLEQSINLLVPEDPSKIEGFIIFKNRLTEEDLYLTDDEVILTEKASKLLQVEVGDQVYIVDENNKKLNLVVGGITEHYAGHYIYMSSSLYENVFNEEVKYSKILAHNTDSSSEFEDDLSEGLLELDDTASVMFTSGISESYNDMLESLNYVIIVIIIAAGLLAFIVLYNLTNINIGERYREIATIKVLGFYDDEVAKYIYRENIVLTILGTAVGLIIGIFLHRFVIETVEIESIMFGRDIKAISFIYAAALTVMFSALVNFVMYYKLKNIDMVESLKSAD